MELHDQAATTVEIVAVIPLDRLNLRREGGQRLEDAVELLNSMRDELYSMESRLEQLIINS